MLLEHVSSSSTSKASTLSCRMEFPFEFLSTRRVEHDRSPRHSVARRESVCQNRTSKVYTKDSKDSKDIEIMSQ